MTEKDLHLEFKRDTGEYPINIEDSLMKSPVIAIYILDYIHWLEQLVIEARSQSSLQVKIDGKALGKITDRELFEINRKDRP